MREADRTKIKELIEQGYHIEVINPNGNTFRQRYSVWQGAGWDKLKVVVTDADGNVTELQG